MTLNAHPPVTLYIIFQRPKPLMWERQKFTERFQFVNKSKLVHIVVDDQLDSEAAASDRWYSEQFQTTVGLLRVKEWVQGWQHISYRTN